MRHYRVKVIRWDFYVLSHIEARSESHAEERAMELFENATDHEHLDGGYKLVEAELEDE